MSCIFKDGRRPIKMILIVRELIKELNRHDKEAEVEILEFQGRCPINKVEKQEDGSILIIGIP